VGRWDREGGRGWIYLGRYLLCDLSLEKRRLGFLRLAVDYLRWSPSAVEFPIPM
jgi:hypothetical protein